MKTLVPKVNLDQRKWHIVDANGAVLGRLAVQIADILRGKDKPAFTPHLDAGDFVVVINAEKVKVTGKKETDKSYMTYSGWKGGEHFRTVAEMRARHPEKLIMNAVHELIPERVDNRGTKPDVLLPDELLHPGERIGEVASKAHAMGTTLWFTPEQLAGEENTLDALIACGQFTACFNLLEYIIKLKAGKDYQALSQATKAEIDKVYTVMWEDWIAFKQDPYWFQKKFYPFI